MSKGFTLLELLITLAITGILILFAYPSYQEHITRTRRVEGQTALLHLANQMEMYYGQNETYATATIGTHTSTDVLANPLTHDKHYTLTIANANETTYTLHAIPNNMQAMHDKRCQTLTYNHLGQKNITEGPLTQPSGKAEQCW